MFYSIGHLFSKWSCHFRPQTPHICCHHSRNCPSDSQAHYLVQVALVSGFKQMQEKKVILCACTLLCKSDAVNVSQGEVHYKELPEQMQMQCPKDIECLLAPVAVFSPGTLPHTHRPQQFYVCNKNY